MEQFSYNKYDKNDANKIEVDLKRGNESKSSINTVKSENKNINTNNTNTTSIANKFESFKKYQYNNNLIFLHNENIYLNNFDEGKN